MSVCVKYDLAVPAALQYDGHCADQSNRAKHKVEVTRNPDVE